MIFVTWSTQWVFAILKASMYVTANKQKLSHDHVLMLDYLCVYVCVCVSSTGEIWGHLSDLKCIDGA